MADFYTTDRALAEYLLFHYGDDAVVLPWDFGPTGARHFPVRCVAECLLADRVPSDARALDVGCAVGRSSFELARYCSRVTAFDLSPRFIEAGRQIQAGVGLEFPVCVEGNLTQPAVARLPAGVDPARVHFEVGDALNLRADLGAFDVILAANVVDRVARPRHLVSSLADLVTPRGQLVLTSPYTWLEDYTPRSEWLCAGGQTSFDAIARVLAGWQCARRINLPFVIREHARKYQWSVAEASTWVRREPGRAIPGSAR